MSLFDRVVFMGNSITRHPPKEEIGWSGNWGMAASSAEKDYVHTLMRQIQNVHAAASFLVTNDFGFEQQYWDFDLAKMDEIKEFQATLFILCIGDNVLEDLVEVNQFGRYYQNLLDCMKPEEKGQMVCASCFWPKTKTDELMREAAASQGCVFVEIGHLVQDEQNMAIGQYWHKGVAGHPSDKGMSGIAGLIWSKLASLEQD